MIYKICKLHIKGKSYAIDSYTYTKVEIQNVIKIYAAHYVYTYISLVSYASSHAL